MGSSVSEDAKNKQACNLRGRILSFSLLFFPHLPLLFLFPLSPFSTYDSYDFLLNMRIPIAGLLLALPFVHSASQVPFGKADSLNATAASQHSKHNSVHSSKHNAHHSAAPSSKGSKNETKKGSSDSDDTDTSSSSSSHHKQSVLELIFPQIKTNNEEDRKHMTHVAHQQVMHDTAMSEENKIPPGAIPIENKPAFGNDSLPYSPPFYPSPKVKGTGDWKVSTAISILDPVHSIELKPIGLTCTLSLRLNFRLQLPRQRSISKPSICKRR